MDFENYFSQEWKPVASTETGSKSLSDGFDCNICFELVRDPVVTLCGHLYCWPCIYKWLHVRSTSTASDEHPQCPVCKADICHTTMVPLYGHGQASKESELEGKKPCQDIFIPPRPSACGTKALLPSTFPNVQQLPHQNYGYNPSTYGNFVDASTSPSLNIEDNTLPGINYSSVGMYGEMVYARVFGNSQSLFTYPNSYHLAGSSSARLRRLEIQADKSLSRISLFLFCCFLLCLIVF